MIAGAYSDGQSSKTEPATLHRQGEWVEIRDSNNKTLRRVALSLVNITSRLGNTPRSVILGAASGSAPVAQFETDDNDAIDRLFAGSGVASTLLHRLESHIGLITSACVFTVAFVFWLVVWGVPHGATVLAYSLPDELVSRVGDHTLEVLDATYLEPSELDAGEQQRIRGVLAPHVLTGPVTLHFRKWVPNALALPDGSIVLTDELIELADHDEELIAIAYHELGHVEHRHLLRRSLQGSVIAIFLFLLTGDVTNSDLLVTAPAVLVDLAYSREFETEADRYALRAMTQSGIDPIHFRNIMQKLEDWYTDQDEDGDAMPAIFQYLSTHPQTEERIVVIEAHIE